MGRRWTKRVWKGNCRIGLGETSSRRRKELNDRHRDRVSPALSGVSLEERTTTVREEQSCGTKKKRSWNSIEERCLLVWSRSIGSTTILARYHESLYQQEFLGPVGKRKWCAPVQKNGPCKGFESFAFWLNVMTTTDPGGADGEEGKYVSGLTVFLIVVLG